MNLNIDFGTAIVTAGMTISAVISYVWLKISPIERDLAELKRNYMSPEEIKLLIDKKISSHERWCRQERLNQTGVIRIEGGK